LNERQRTRGRVSSSGLWTARQQVSALHLRAETLPCAVFARSSRYRQGAGRELLRRS
jgi:hypothetical protein